MKNTSSLNGYVEQDDDGTYTAVVTLDNLPNKTIAEAYAGHIMDLLDASIESYMYQAVGGTLQ
jgi:hypothetical protein